MSLAVDGNRTLYFLCKRFIDLVLTSLLVLLLLPLMLLIAVAIKLDTPGPIFFIQERVGARRRSERGRTRWEVRTFEFYKFRSMVTDADQSLHEEYVRAFVQGRLEGAKGSPAKFKLPRDPRITRIGRLLRRMSLDELPQLFNVLKGDMSLVGPRPVPRYEVVEYREGDAERLTAPPGITGLWQVNGRSDLPWDEAVRLDLRYVENWSLALDLQILWKTWSAVIRGHGAY